MGLHASRRRSPLGFTLLELLVSLTLMALLTGVAVLAVRPADAERASLEQWAIQLNGQADAALLEQRHYSLGIGTAGYRLWQHADDDTAPALLAETPWPNALPTALRVDNQLISLDPWPEQPHIGFWADGTVTAFSLAFGDQQLGRDTRGLIVLDTRREAEP